MNYFEINNLSVDFGGLRAVNSLDMELGQGEIRGIIGPNGAGKTTLFNLISGIYPPMEGEIYFQGLDLVKLPPHKIASYGIARTFQNIQLFESLSVVENVIVGMHSSLKIGIFGSYLKIGKARRKEKRARSKALEILDFLGMREFCDRPATHLSFGQMRILEIARALAADPKILLLDEPAAGIHPNKIAEIDNLLRKLRDDKGLTILIIEHVLKLVMSISDRVTVLDQGAKIAEGSPSEIQNNIEVTKVYLGQDSQG
jgi:branched-chain amino acid transport system ATP-binding protein